MRMRILISLLFLLGGLLLAGSGYSDNAQQLLTFKTLQKGVVSPYDNHQPDPAQISVIRNHTDWANFWNMLYINSSSTPDLPSVDFGENFVVAVVDAPRPTGGYSITITSIQFLQPKSAGVRVNCSRISPGQGCIVSQSSTQPFHIVTVPIFPGEATLALFSWEKMANCSY